MKIIDPIFPLILKNIQNKETKNVLEIGCLDGRLARQLSKYFQFVQGIDPNLKVKEIQEQSLVLSKIKVEEMKMKQLQSFDVYLFTESLHHVPFSFQEKFFNQIIKLKEAVIIESTLQGNYDYFHKPFDDSCHQLIPKTARLIQNSVKKNNISIILEQEFFYQYEFKNYDDLLEFFVDVFPHQKEEMKDIYPKIIKDHRYSFPLILKEKSVFRIIKGLKKKVRL